MPEDQDEGFSSLFYIALIVGIIGVLGLLAVGACPQCFV